MNKTRERILLVDDDAVMRMLGRHHLESAGFEVHECGDGGEVLACAKALRPDAILLDVVLPGRDGFSICCELRALEEIRDIPILMMTGLEDAASIERAYEVGATQFTTKPVNWLNEIFRLRFMLRAAHATRALAGSRAEIAASKEQWEQTFAAIEDIIILFDQDLRVKQANQAAARSCGIALKELAGKKFHEIVCRHGEPCADCPALRVLRSGLPLTQERSGCLQDQRIRMMSVWPIIPDGKSIQGLVMVARDITDYKNLEREYLHAQKMEAVGVLAAGVAHDFNNLLQAISGYAELMAAEPPGSELFNEGVREIRVTARRGRDLTRQLLAASRKVDSHKLPMQVGEAVFGMEKLLRRTLPRTVDILVSIEDEVGEIEADRTQFEQIIMNLSLNASQAMPQGGRLSLLVGKVELDEDYVQLHPGAQTGEHVCLSVCDTGSGMSLDTQERIFEPFFTTKPPGEGTGLGLSVVYNIVKNHGGHIACQSELGKGACFRIYFPSCKGRRAREAVRTGLPPPRARGETILLVDDEPLLRRLGGRMLERHGYQVLTADNGAAALEVYKERRGGISLVLLDLNMPVMGGQECLEKLLALDPAVKVIIVTGMVTADYRAEILSGKVKSVVMKPYEEQPLLMKIHEAIHKPAPANGAAEDEWRAPSL